MFRLHANPRRTPYLTDAHLDDLDATALPRPRVLFVGNSMILRNDLPARVVAHAATEGRRLGIAVAAAGGARLIETWRIDAFRQMLARESWDAVVVQDFTKTPLRLADRVGSALAIRAIASAVAPAPVLLYPPFPALKGNGVYRDAGFLTTVPKDPKDYARHTMAHYSALESSRIVVSPVPLLWLDEDRSDFYASDGHHPSEEGSAFIAGVLWNSLRPLLRDHSQLNSDGSASRPA